ncbi:hypothetical protein H632_c3317p0, partial [Helicosporidium sp. ATCC 50920]
FPSFSGSCEDSAHPRGGGQWQGPGLWCRPFRGPPGLHGSGVQAAPRGHLQNCCNSSDRPAHPSHRVHRQGARGVARGVDQARAPAAPARVQAVPGERRLFWLHGGRNSAAGGHVGGASADDRLPDSSRGWPAAPARLSERPGLPHLSLHAVRAPREPPGVHARAGHRARDDRPRAHAGAPRLLRPGACHWRGQPGRRREHYLAFD